MRISDWSSDVCSSDLFPSHDRGVMIKKDLLGDLKAFTPSATILRASMSNPESVSSKIARSGSSSDICKTSLRFFSPPEKPTFNALPNCSSLMPSFLACCLTRDKIQLHLLLFDLLLF